LVSTGSYQISARTEGTLDAILASCVGISIYDPEAEVGGLIHLLLPEPVNPSGSRNPEKYASTGLPLFLKALCEQGASTDRMKASVAGGALVEPLSELDLILDIGGRTADIAEKILESEGIKVKRSETGGVLGCRMSLDLNTWGTSVEPLGVLEDDSHVEHIKIPGAEELDRRIESVKPIPQVALKLIRMINDAQYEVKDMAVEVSKDQVLCAKVLRMCNSVFFGLKKRVDSIDRAIILLGDKRFLRLAVSASLEDIFPERGGYSLCKGGIYYHAVGMAMLLEKLAKSYGGISTGIAYTAGLLHDIGKVVLDQFLGPFLPLFYRRMNGEGTALVRLEKDSFGFDHGEAGLRLAEQWKLPGNLRDAIGHHHSPEKAEEARDLAELVYLGELISSKVLPGNDLEHLDKGGLERRLKAIGIDQDGFSRAIDLVPDELFQTQGLESVPNGG